MDRRQNNGSVKAVSPRCTIAVSTAVLGQSHKDNVRCTAVEEQLEAKEVQLSQPSSTYLLMISSGLTWGSSSTSLLLISSGTLRPKLPRKGSYKHPKEGIGPHASDCPDADIAPSLSHSGNAARNGCVCSPTDRETRPSLGLFSASQ